MTTRDVSLPLYFGCWNNLGHYFWTVRGERSDYGAAKASVPWLSIDGRLNPSERQGEAALHHAGGVTALAWADRTVDKRSGSNSIVFLAGTLTFEEAVAAASEAFPHVMERQPTPLSPVTP